jgi:hypothetical protein
MPFFSVGLFDAFRDCSLEDSRPRFRYALVNIDFRMSTALSGAFHFSLVPDLKNTISVQPVSHPGRLGSHPSVNSNRFSARASKIPDNDRSSAGIAGCARSFLVCSTGPLFEIRNIQMVGRRKLTLKIYHFAPHLDKLCDEWRYFHAEPAGGSVLRIISSTQGEAVNPGVIRDELGCAHIALLGRYPCSPRYASRL